MMMTISNTHKSKENSVMNSPILSPRFKHFMLPLSLLYLSLINYFKMNPRLLVVSEGAFKKKNQHNLMVDQIKRSNEFFQRFQPK